MRQRKRTAKAKSEGRQTRRKRKSSFRLRDASFKGRGLHPDVAGKDWSEIRDLIYDNPLLR